ncbi:uncharacterized protein LOC144730406 isoform X8 [Lampetra planeri]
MADRERNKKSLHELLRRPGNECCADCGLPDPDWASYTLGVFICLHCSGIHRNMTEVSRVKSLRLDFWEDEQVEFMANKGNVAAKELYEQRIPPFYYRPTADDCQLPGGVPVEARTGQQPVPASQVHPVGARGGAQVLHQERREGAQGRVENRRDQCNVPAGQDRQPQRPAGHLPEGWQHPQPLRLPRGGQGDRGLVQCDPRRTVPLPEGGLPRHGRQGDNATAHQELREGGIHGEDGAQAKGEFPATLVYAGCRRPAPHVFQGSPGRVCQGRGVPGQWRPRLRGAGGLPAGPPGPSLGVRHHHRHARAQRGHVSVETARAS